MPNEENLEKRVPFEPNDPRINKEGRPKGSRNRSTVAKEILALTAKFPDKVFATLIEQYPALKKEMTIEEMMTIVQADRAIRKQDSRSYQVLMDSAHGQAKQSTELTGADGQPLAIQITVSGNEKGNETPLMLRINEKYGT